MSCERLENGKRDNFEKTQNALEYFWQDITDDKIEIEIILLRG